MSINKKKLELLVRECAGIKSSESGLEGGVAGLIALQVSENVTELHRKKPRRRKSNSNQIKSKEMVRFY